MELLADPGKLAAPQEHRTIGQSHYGIAWPVKLKR
jgi:hypothetical protein